jgi:predicted DCC family thiol-disulfide oxidoreductase YuxK
MGAGTAFERRKVRDGRAWSGMEAVIRIGAPLGGPGVPRLFPRPAREWHYRRIAHNRYRFGRTDICVLPDAELREAARVAADCSARTLVVTPDGPSGPRDRA